MTGRVVFRMLEGAGDRLSWDFSSDGKTLTMATFGGPLRIWDLPSARAQVAYGNVRQAIAVKWSPDGKFLLVGESGTPSFLLETDSWKRLRDYFGMEVHDPWTLYWSLDSASIAGWYHEWG